MQKVTPSEEHSWWGGPRREELPFSGALISPHGLAGGHRGASEPAPAPEARLHRSQPRRWARKACRRLTCAPEADPRSRPLRGTRPDRLPREDALHHPLPCPGPQSSPRELCLPRRVRAPGRAPQEGPSALLSGAPGSSQGSPGFREPPKPRGEARERSQACGSEPLALVHEVEGSIRGAPLTQQTGSPRTASPAATVTPPSARDGSVKG